MSINELVEGNCYVGLTNDTLNAQAIMDRVRSPKAGAIVLFAGTTRDNFDGKPVTDLKYSSYEPRALKTMLSICKSMAEKHSLTSIAIIHRLGVVPIAEESILIAVSTPHRKAAWEAGEETLELCKEKVEIWKLEEFGGDEPGLWRANRDGASGVPVTTGVKGIVKSAMKPLREKPTKPLDDRPAFDVPKGASGEPLKPPTGSTTTMRSPFERGHGPVKRTDNES